MSRADLRLVSDWVVGGAYGQHITATAHCVRPQVDPGPLLSASASSISYTRISLSVVNMALCGTRIPVSHSSSSSSPPPLSAKQSSRERVARQRSMQTAAIRLTLAPVFWARHGFGRPVTKLGRHQIGLATSRLGGRGGGGDVVVLTLLCLQRGDHAEHFAQHRLLVVEHDV